MKECFNIQKGDCISIVGAGGKTSLMFALADELTNAIITTSTKIFDPETTNVYIDENPPGKGVFVIGKEIVRGKIIGYKEKHLKSIISGYDQTLIEADGSKRMSLKGWKENEPNIYSISNKTIGVLDIQVVGRNTVDTVFRVDEYAKFTRMQKEINLKNLVDLILDKNGLFRKSSYKILYINKVEDEISEKNAFSLIDCLKEDPRFDLDKIIIGSVKKRQVRCMYDANSIFVLASGSSTRMNGDKLSMDLNGKMVIEHIMDTLIDFPQDKYLVCKDERFVDLIHKYGFKLIINEESDKGISSSIKRTLDVDTDNFIYLLGDMPFISKKTIGKLINNYDLSICKSSTHSIPAKISSKYLDKLSLLEGDQGAKSIILDNLDKTLVINLKDNELVDIDTLKDLEEVRK